MPEDVKHLAEDLAKSLHENREVAERAEEAAKKNGEMSAEHKQQIETLDAKTNSLEEKLQAALQANKDLEAKADKIVSAVTRPGYAADTEAAKLADYKDAVKARILEGKSFNPEDFGARSVAERDGSKAAFQIDWLKLMSTDSYPDGGWSVDIDDSGRRVRTERESSPIMEYATVTTCSSTILQGDYDDGDAGIVKRGERENMPATSTPQMGDWKIDLNGYTASPDLTRWLQQDSNVNIVSLLQEKVNRDMQLAINADAVKGTGNKELRGFTTYANGTTRGTIQRQTTAAAGVISLDDILKLKDLTKIQYDANARLFMTKQSGGVLRRLKDNEGQYLWQPSLIAGVPGVFDGTEVVYFQDMVKPSGAGTYTTGELPIAYADMARAYQVADRGIFDVIVDEVTDPGRIKYHFIRRMGGDVVNFEAIKLLEIQ